MIRRRGWLLAVILSAGCDGCPGEPDPELDPGDCWLELGDLADATAVGWYNDQLVAGLGTGQLGCWNPTTSPYNGSWTLTQLTPDPIGWVSTQTHNQPGLGDVMVATEREIWRGTCGGPWLPTAQWPNSNLSLGGRAVVDLDNADASVALIFDTGEVWSSDDAGVTWARIADLATFNASQPETIEVEHSGAVAVTTGLGVSRWDGVTWTSLGAPATGRVERTGTDALLVFQGQDLFRRPTGLTSTFTQTCCATVQSSTLTSSAVDTAFGQNDLFLGTVGTGVILSIDAGLSWERYPSGYPMSGLGAPASIRSVDLDDRGLPTLATASGVFLDHSDPPGSPCRKPGRYGNPDDDGGDGPIDDPTLRLAVWDDGTTAPLGCDLRADCCAELGVCDAFGPDGTPTLADQEAELSGTIEIVHALGVDVVPVIGWIRWSAPRCDAGEGTCPWYLEGLDLQADKVAGGAGPVWYQLDDVNGWLNAPVLGGWRVDTGELRVPGADLWFDLSAAGGATSVSGDTGPLALGQPIDGYLTGGFRDGRPWLRASRAVSGVTVNLALD